MKKLLLFSMLVIALPQTMSAQDDDLYFVPKKTTAPEVAQDRFGMPKDTYYSGSDRSVDEYNRRFKSRVEVLDGDTTKNDIIDFSAEKGVYPDSLQIEDYKLTKRMSRFEDYRLADNAAFWAGYDAGRRDWGWHSPWYYSSYGWYDPGTTAVGVGMTLGMILGTMVTLAGMILGTTVQVGAGDGVGVILTIVRTM